MSSIVEYGVTTTLRIVGEAALRKLAARLGLMLPPPLGVPRHYESTDPPLVSIIAPVRDQDETLPVALSKMQRQNFTRWECVVVDDASEDRTRETAQQFARRDDRIRILANRRQVGLATSERIGRSQARANVVIPLEATAGRSRRLVDRRYRKLSSPPRSAQSNSAANSPYVARFEPGDKNCDVVVPWPAEFEATREAVDGAVILVAEAEYHVAEFGPLARELRRRGRRVEFMAAPLTSSSARFAIGSYAERILGFDSDAVVSAEAVLTLNDWGKCRPLVERARAAGVPTFAKVEGVQDFDDVDTGRQRHPYRSSEFVLAQGANDVEALRHLTCFVVGSERLERIWRAPVAPANDRVLVNVNFTYDVLIDERDRWLSMVEQAVDGEGLEGIVSKHPADRGETLGLLVSGKPFRYDASRGGVLISRFSTVAFEAMARGMGFVYFNPHGERVPTFASPGGAFIVGVTVEELADALRKQDYLTPQRRRDRYEEFFRAQVDMVDDRTPAERTADVLDDVLGGIDQLRA